MMSSLRTSRRLITAITCVLAMAPLPASSDPVQVRFAEGVVHGFLALRTLDGATIATGDLIQNSRGGRVTARLVFRFKDGSLHDETAVFSQRGHFRLISNRLVQKGPAFKKPLEMTIDCTKNVVTVRYTSDGEPKVETEQSEIPPDVSNGMMLTLLKNIRPTVPVTVSMLAATPKPRLVKLEVSSVGEETFSVGGAAKTATHYVVHVELGGLTGILASVFGKEPPDTHVWILGGDAPAFVKSEGPFFAGGPSWRIELVSPVWPRRPTTH